MIRFYTDNVLRTPFDILYGTTDKIESPMYSVHFLDEKNYTDLTEPYTYYVRDQNTENTNANALMISLQKNNGIVLYNKIPKSITEVLVLYEQLSTTTGAIVTLSTEVYNFFDKLNAETGHLKCALEELAEVSYQTNLGIRNKTEKLKVYFDGRLANVFYGYCIRKWSAENPILNEYGQLTLQADVGLFAKTDNISEADVFVSFEKYDREYLRMISQRVGNIYVPFRQEYSVFDPRSFFRVHNLSFIESLDNSNITDHEIASQFKALFEDMYGYIQTVFITDTIVNNMKLTGSNYLFTSLAYNLNRTV